MEKYVELKNLKYAKKDEVICASYPNPVKNVSGTKNEEHIKLAAKEAKEGKCRLLVWRRIKPSEQEIYKSSRQNQMLELAVHMENRKTCEKRIKKVHGLDSSNHEPVKDFYYESDWIWCGTEPFKNVADKVKPIGDGYYKMILEETNDKERGKSNRIGCER